MMMMTTTRTTRRSLPTRRWRVRRAAALCCTCSAVRLRPLAPSLLLAALLFPAAAHVHGLPPPRARMVVSFVRMRTPPKFTQLEDKHNITTHNLSSLASPSPLSYTLDSAFHACSPCLCPHPVASPRLPALAAEKPKAGTKRAADGKAKKEESSEEEDSDDDEDEEEVRRAGA